jgi:hypothetical protein
LFLTVAVACRPMVDFGAVGRLDSPADILARVQAAEGMVRSIKADARLELESPNGGGGAGAFVSALRPTFVYLEFQDLLGKPQATLTTNGERFGTFQGSEGRYYRGPASPVNVSRLLPLELPAEDIVRLLLGEVPKLEGVPDKVELDDAVGAYRLSWTAGPQTQTIWVSPKTFRVLKSERQGTPDAYSVDLEDFLEATKLAFPRDITVRAPQKKTRVRLRYKSRSMELNGSVEPSMFDLTAPEGVPVVEVDADGSVHDAPRGR